MIACITDGIISGYGEATVNPYYNSTIERLSESFSRAQPLISKVSELHPADLWRLLEPHLFDNYFALCAIDIAYWDYFSRKNNRTLRSYFSDSASTPLTSYTIGIDSIDVMKQKIIEMPWPIYKIKLGTKHDIQIVEELRKISNAVFRIDANGSWTADQAIENSFALKDLNVEFIEQPLAADDIAGMKKVKSASALPLIADESCQRSEDVLKCSDTFHGINIKLMKCGGITPALDMIETARKHDLLLMAGCMTESSVGISALTQIAPLLDYIDADGALLLSQDIARGVTFEQGRIHYSGNFGSGVEICK